MKEIRIWLDDETYNELKETTNKKHMTLSEYIRDILNKQSGVELKIDFTDIDQYVQDIEALTRKIDAVLPTIYNTDRIYEQQAVYLKQVLTDINDKAEETWKYVTETRTKMYDEVRKKLYHSVKQNGYKRRRTSPASNTKS